MRILLLPDNLYEYLQHVVRTHAVSGIEPEEGLAIYQLNQHVGAAQSVDITSLGKAKLENLGPEGVSLRFEPNAEPAVPAPASDPAYPPEP